MSAAAPLAPPASAPVVSRPGLGLAGLLVVVVALLAQGVTLRGTAALDDVGVVERNAALARGLGALPRAFREPSWPGELERHPYRPLAVASFHLDRAVGGPGARLGVSHAVNLGLHALAALLLAGLLLALLPGRPVVALGGGLLFACHPLAAAAVAPLVGRSVLLGVVLGLLALRGWSASGRGRGVLLAWSCVALLLALLACEALVALPLVALILDRVEHGRGPVAALRARPAAYAAWFAVLLLWLALWLGHGPGAGAVALPEPGPGARLALGAEALARGALHLAVPLGFVADRSHEARAGVGWPLEGARLVAVFLSAVGLLAALVLPAGRGALAGLRAAVVAAGLVLAGAALCLPLGAVLEDRWAYLALPAWAALGGWAAQLLAVWSRGAPGRRAVARAAVGPVLLALTLLGVGVARSLADDRVAHERLIDLPGGHGPAMVRLAERLTRRAQEELDASARKPVRDPDPLRDPGRAPHVLAAHDLRGRALDLLTLAVKRPATREDPQAWLLLGLLQLESPSSGMAMETLNRARRLDPLLSGRDRDALAHDPAAHRRAARIYHALLRAHATAGRPQAAADAAQEVVRLEQRAASLAGEQPDWNLLLRAGIALAGDGRYAEGLKTLEQVALMADDGTVRAQALAQVERGRQSAVERVDQLLADAAANQERVETKRLALDGYEEALRIDPDSHDARYWAAHLRGMYMGSYERAVAYVDEGLARLAGQPPSAERDRRRRQLEELKANLLERREREEHEQDAPPSGGKPR